MSLKDIKNLQAEVEEEILESLMKLNRIGIVIADIDLETHDYSFISQVRANQVLVNVNIKLDI